MEILQFVNLGKKANIRTFKNTHRFDILTKRIYKFKY